MKETNESRLLLTTGTHAASMLPVRVCDPGFVLMSIPVIQQIGTLFDLNIFYSLTLFDKAGPTPWITSIFMAFPSKQ